MFYNNNSNIEQTQTVSIPFLTRHIILGQRIFKII